mmetsp:Transcript_1955/g.3401  ORF Transcript_1955/g.3401 Transcript_1955/m.3401 type:complete len:229 (-) Transcript_1955:675-1361(-)
MVEVEGGLVLPLVPKLVLVAEDDVGPVGHLGIVHLVALLGERLELLDGPLAVVGEAAAHDVALLLHAQLVVAELLVVVYNVLAHLVVLQSQLSRVHAVEGGDRFNLLVVGPAGHLSGLQGSRLLLDQVAELGDHHDLALLVLHTCFEVLDLALERILVKLAQITGHISQLIAEAVAETQGLVGLLQHLGVVERALVDQIVEVDGLVAALLLLSPRFPSVHAVIRLSRC